MTINLCFHLLWIFGVFPDVSWENVVEPVGSGTVPRHDSGPPSSLTSAESSVVTLEWTANMTPKASEAAWRRTGIDGDRATGNDADDGSSDSLSNVINRQIQSRVVRILFQGSWISMIFVYSHSFIEANLFSKNLQLYAVFYVARPGCSETCTTAETAVFLLVRAVSV